MSISDFESSEVKAVSWTNPTETNPPSPVGTQDTAVTSTIVTAPTVEPTTTESPSSSNGVISITSAPTETSAPAEPQVNSILQGIMNKIGPVGTHSNLKLMIIGDPGSTKSSIAATAPNNLIVDAEDGMLAAKNSPNGIADGVQTYPWGGFDDLRNLVGALMQNPAELEAFKVFTLDTLSEVHKRGLQEVMAKYKAMRPSINEFVPETEHHTENNERIIRMVRALRDMKRDLIIISHARTVETKNKKTAKTYADFSESLSNKIMAMMDVVGYMSWKMIDNTPTPVMRVISDGTIHCKNRLGMPEEIINPTYANIREAWERTLAK